MDANTGIGFGLTVLGSKDILNKILGPTADYLGDELKNIAVKCNINLDSIFQRAQRKLGDRLDTPGTVNPRILKHVIDEGRFCEDELVAEYYGGVLAASKGSIDRDDRGVAILATVKNMSVYELRMHYLFYYLIRKIYKDKGKHFGEEHSRMEIYIPATVYDAAMAFTADEYGIAGAFLAHSVQGLLRSGMIGTRFRFGPTKAMTERFAPAQEPGAILTPTLYGAEVFLWGQGLHGATGHELLDPAIELPEPPIVILAGAQPTSNW